MITEFPVTAARLSGLAPKAGLLPGPRQRGALSWIEYIVSTLHMRGAAFVFRPSRFTTLPAAQEELATHGRAVVAEGYKRLSQRLGGAERFFDRPGALEATAFYLMNGSPRLGLELPGNLAGLLTRLEKLRQ